ncbi:MAG TPA: ATP-binding protein [Gaiellaceae bacterium]|jgi:serine/threonine-protein kinase RsbW|nr:ATP-binding protein [Gaiellaceae bacterium]
MAEAPTTLRFRLSNEPDATCKLRAALTHVAEEVDLPEEERFELKVAATEAFTNAIKGAPGEHAVEVAIRGSDAAVDVEVVDRGRFALQMRNDEGLEAESGRGIPLMLALVDEVEFAAIGDGTRVRMRKRARHRRPHL